MQVSKTYDYEKNDHINRANMALICSRYFGIKDVSPSLYQIAAPVAELAYTNKNGKAIHYRDEIEESIPWNERSMKTFGVVYRYEATASFIGMDGKTYVVPNDQPVLDHLKECGYVIAPYGKNLDGDCKEDDRLIFEEKNEDEPFSFDRVIVDRNLPVEIVKKIDEMENDRPYYNYNQSYAMVVSFAGTFGLFEASEEELQQLSLSERKIANIYTYSRVMESQNIDDYVQFALQQHYLNDQSFIGSKKS